MSSLRERLAIALAKKRGGSQAGLARACGIKSASVSNWFTGKTKTLKGESLLAAARYLGVRPDWLSRGIGPMELDPAGTFTVLQAREPDMQTAPPWPFALITPKQWGSLTQAQQGRVEGFIEGLLFSPGASPRRSGTNG